MVALLAESWPLGTSHAVAAYAVIFVAFFGYIGWMHLATRRLEQRLRELEEGLRRGGGTSGSP